MSCVESDLRFIFTKGTTLIDDVFKKFYGWAWESGHHLHIVYMSRLLSCSWQIDGETVETVAELLLFFGSKITVDGDCSHEIKRRLLFGRKVMTNLDSIFKSRDITLPTKVLLVKAMGFPVGMYASESWTIKIAER